MISNDDGGSTHVKTASLPASNARLSKKGGSSKVYLLEVKLYIVVTSAVRYFRNVCFYKIGFLFLLKTDHGWK